MIPTQVTLLPLLFVTAAAVATNNNEFAATQLLGSSIRRGNGGSTNGSNRGLRWSKESREEQRRQQSRNLQAASTASAKDACDAARANEESDIAGDSAASCECNEMVLDERYAEFLDIENAPVAYELNCYDERCSYCSKDGTTCDRFSYGAIFEEYTDPATGSAAVAQVAYFETNQYIVGRPEGVVYTEYHDPNMEGLHACSMDIDGLRCAVCEYIDCVGDGTEPDLYYGLKVSCSNILIGDGQGGSAPAQDFETCDKTQIEVIGGSQGVFEMYDEDYGACFSSEGACERDREEFQALMSGNYYACECGDAETEGMSPYLENVQLTCRKNSADAGGAPCADVAEDTITRTYSSYATESDIRTVTYGDGRIVSIEESDCQTTAGANGCALCRATVGGEECEECTMLSCGEGNVARPTIRCGGDPIDLCKENDESTFKHFSIDTECGGGGYYPVVPESTTEEEKVEDTDQATSQMACEEKRSELAAGRSYVDSLLMVCDCYDIDESDEGDSGTLLECTMNGGGCGTVRGGSVCNMAYESNEDEGTCFREEIVQGFLADGSTTPFTRTTTYTHGNSLGNELIGRTLTLTEYSDSECSMAVDGEECNSCQLQSCANNLGTRPIVDCTNVIGDPSLKLSSCEEVPLYDDGLLLRLAAYSDPNNEFSNFSVCSKSPVDGGQGGDPSLPNGCQNAQVITLPSQQDVSISRQNNEIERIGANFVSITSTTTDIDAERSSSNTNSCSGEESSNVSPSLWYSFAGNGQGVHASVCRKPTDFDARISVYTSGNGSSGCDGLVCVIATSPIIDAGICDVNWVTKEDTTYYIRVHGSDASQFGPFNLFIETLPDEYIGACSSDTTDNLNPSCIKCLQKADSRKNSQTSEQDCQCIPNPGTGGYHLTCVDVGCLKCNLRYDVCGFDTFELDIDKQGESPQPSYESFYLVTQTDGQTSIEIADLSSSQQCIDIKDPENVCMENKDAIMSNTATGGDVNDDPNNKLLCECRKTPDEEGYMLLCSIYDYWSYCVPEENNNSICASVLFGQSINPYGLITNRFRNFDYVGDREGSIVVERNDYDCSVSVNDEQCNSCSIVQCDNGNVDNLLADTNLSSDMGIFTDLSIDCTNVNPGAKFACGIIGDGSILSILTGTLIPSGDGDNNDPKPQTVPPITFPTMAPGTSRPPGPEILAPSASPSMMNQTEDGEIISDDDFTIGSNITDSDDKDDKPDVNVMSVAQTTKYFTTAQMILFSTILCLLMQ